MSAQRPISALIVGLLLGALLAAAIVFAARERTVPSAMVGMVTIAPLLVTLLAGCVIAMVVGSRRVAPGNQS